MGGLSRSYFSPEELEAYKRRRQEEQDREAAAIAEGRHRLAAKIVMMVVDKVIAEIIRPGPKPEERECYEVAGELRALVPELEQLAKAIIDVNEGVE